MNIAIRFAPFLAMAVWVSIYGIYYLLGSKHFVGVAYLFLALTFVAAGGWTAFKTELGTPPSNWSARARVLGGLAAFLLAMIVYSIISIVTFSMNANDWMMFFYAPAVLVILGSYYVMMNRRS